MSLSVITISWRLAAGDIEANLRQLEAEAAPADMTARKVWHLLKMGFSVRRLVDALKLFREVRATTADVEQAHASAATVGKYHSEFGPESIHTRSFVNLVRSLLPVVKEAAPIRRCLRKLKRLKRKPARFQAGSTSSRTWWPLRGRRWRPGRASPSGG